MITFPKEEFSKWISFVLKAISAAGSCLSSKYALIHIDDNLLSLRFFGKP